MSCTEIKSPKEVAKYVHQKQIIEVSLAWDLLETFNTEPRLLNPIKNRAIAALSNMRQTRFHASTSQDIVQRAIDKTFVTARSEQQRMAQDVVKMNLPVDKDIDKIARNRIQRRVNKNFPVLKWPTLEILYNNSEKFDIQDCCWVIRMYGEFLEQMIKKSVSDEKWNEFTKTQLYKRFKNDNLRKRKLRVGFQFKPWKKTERKLQEELVGAETATTGTRWVENFMGRKRDVVEAGEQSADDINYLTDVTCYDAGMTHFPYQFVNSLAGGISILRPAESSVSLKLDRVFGLMPGATISGTTTDLMFFMDTFASSDPDPIYYLAAVAGIVSQGHHTILEVALPLAFNGWIDYKIGLYSTLLPEGKGKNRPETKHTATSKIRRILKAYENNDMNNRILVYYKSSNVYGGCFKFDKHDINFKTLAAANDKSVNQMKGYFQHEWPSRDEVVKWIKVHYPKFN